MTIPTAWATGLMLLMKHGAKGASLVVIWDNLSLAMPRITGQQQERQTADTIHVEQLLLRLTCLPSYRVLLHTM